MERMYKFNEFKLLEKDDIGSTKYINPKYVIMVDDLHSRINDLIMPELSDAYKMTYKRGESIVIYTGDEKDLYFKVTRSDDMLSIKVNPVNGIDYEYSFSVSMSGIETIFDTIDSEVAKTPNGGIYVQDKTSTSEIDYNERPARVRRSVKFEHIRDILEDAFRANEIDLKDIRVDELIKRMKLK